MKLKVYCWINLSYIWHKIVNSTTRVLSMVFDRSSEYHIDALHISYANLWIYQLCIINVNYWCSLNQKDWYSSNSVLRRIWLRPQNCILNPILSKFFIRAQLMNQHWCIVICVTLQQCIDLAFYGLSVIMSQCLKWSKFYQYALDWFTNTLQHWCLFKHFSVMVGLC